MEIWRDIPDYEGIYQASNLGNIRTHENKTTYTELRGTRHWKQRILKQKRTTNAKGRTDARVTLWKDGRERTWLVSRLIGLAWCEGYDEGMTINHINGNTLDNRAENLEWTSLADNIRKGFKTGLYVKCAKPILLSDGRRVWAFASMAEASRYVGRNKGYVSNCFKRGNPIISSDGILYKAL